MTKIRQVLIVIVSILLCATAFGAKEKKPSLKSLTTQRQVEETNISQPSQPEAVAPTNSGENPEVPTVVTPSAGETIDWQVMAGGGTVASGGGYTVEGTLGQPVAGLVGTGGTEVHQGYWQDFSVPTSCCVGTTGNVDMVGIIDISDLSLLIAYLTVPSPGKPSLPCYQEANLNVEGIIDLSDLSLLILYLTIPAPNKPVLPNCP